MIIRLSKRRLGIELCIVGAFLLSYYIREVFQPKNWLIVNFVTLLGFGYIILQYGKRLIQGKLTCSILGIFLLMNSLFFLTEINVHHSPVSILKYWTALLPPILLIYLNEVFEKEDFEKIFLFFLRCINFLTIIMFVILVIDIFTEKSAMSLFASISGSTQLQTLIVSKENRYCSIIGHFIPTAHFYIIFYFFNIVADRLEIRKCNPLLVTLISVVGISFAGSKASIVAFLIMVVLFNISSIKKIIGMIVGILALNFAGVFNLVLYRFQSTELTTGRSTVWLYVSSYLTELFPIFLGHGASSVFSLRDATNMVSITAGFEYPIRLFSYEMGVCFTILFYIAVFIVPLIIMIKNKSWQIAICYMLLVLLVNMYNGIGCYLDSLWQYSIYAFFIIGLSKIYGNRTIFKYNRNTKNDQDGI